MENTSWYRTLDGANSSVENRRRLRVLLLEDLPSDALLSERELKKGGLQYELLRTASRQEFESALLEWAPDVILADYHVPGMEALEALELRRSLCPDVPLIYLTGTMGEEVAVDALHRGATDVVMKLRLGRLGPAVRRALDEARALRERAEATQQLESTLERLKQVLEGTILTLAATMEFRDPYTGGHQRRVAGLVRAVAARLGWSQEQREVAYTAALLHDVGKIAVPAEILARPGRLNPHEMGIVRNHSSVGYEILKQATFPWPLHGIVWQHHERLDGSGYPEHLTGERIVPEARLLAVADVVEAMASHRPYRPALGVSAALNEIRAHRGVKYDAQVVDACVYVMENEPVW
jgi:putative nucleotidyltransferase with HDIG domain